MSSSPASVVVVSSANIPVPNNIDGVYINFVTHQTSTSEFSGFDFNPYSGGSSLLFYWGGDAGSANGGLSLDGTRYARLSPGAIVGPNGTFLQTANGANGETANFLTGGTGYLGVKFTNEATGVVDYGYVHISTTAPSGFPATILDYAYENTGAAITVAAVPEPGPLAAVAALGLGLIAVRFSRRRGEAATARTTSR